MLVAIGIVIGLIVGALAGAYAVGALGKSRLGAARQERKLLLEEADREADALRREAQISAREEAVRLRAEIDEEVAGATRVRHAVLWLTVAAYMITYIDRVVISAAVPSIQQEFGFSLVTIGWILGAYQVAYAVFQIPGGWLGDRFGPRRALAAIVVWWSAFTAFTAA